MHIWNEIRPHPFQASAPWYLIIMTLDVTQAKGFIFSKDQTALTVEIRNVVYVFN